MRGTGDWVFRDSDGRRKKAGDEIEGGIGGSGSYDDASERKRFQKALIGLKGSHRGVIGEFDEQVRLIGVASSDGYAESHLKPIRSGARSAGLGGEVHGGEFAIPSTGEGSTASVKPYGFVAVKDPCFPKGVSAGEGGVPAEVHLAYGGKPAERESIVLWVKKGGFGKIQFAGNTLHPIFAAWRVEQTDSSRVSPKGGCSECVADMEEGWHTARGWKTSDLELNTEFNDLTGREIEIPGCWTGNAREKNE